MRRGDDIGTDTGAGPRLGVFGGTFDPIHVGHLVAATWARHAFGLDRVLLVVANVPWQKAHRRAVTPAVARFEVVAAAVDGVLGVEACRLELDRGGPSYTADTVRQLQRAAPGAHLHLIVGADVAAELHTWARVDELRAAVTLVIVDRGGVKAGSDPPGWRVKHLAIPAIDVSSSDLRRRLAQGRPVDFLVPEPAIHCIRRLDLYADTR